MKKREPCPACGRACACRPAAAPRARVAAAAAALGRRTSPAKAAAARANGRAGGRPPIKLRRYVRVRRNIAGEVFEHADDLAGPFRPVPARLKAAARALLTVRAKQYGAGVLAAGIPVIRDELHAHLAGRRRK